MAYDSDVIICLDDCTHVDAPRSVQEQSVRRTIAWAKRCKQEYIRIAEQKKLEPKDQPRIFAVIQGGGCQDLRKQCADELLEIGFDGFGFGGWPLDSQGNLLIDILEFVRRSFPQKFPLHALGVGHPGNVAVCFHLGYSLFDSAMPTRDARHGRLYTFTIPTEFNLDSSSNRWFEYVYINDAKHIKSSDPVSEYCDCLTCRQYSLGYLHHLFKIEDTLYYRLATIHNVRFMTQLCERLSPIHHG